MSLSHVGAALRGLRPFRPQASASLSRPPLTAFRSVLGVGTRPSLMLSRSFAEEADLDPLDVSADERSHRKGRKESELAAKRKKQKQEMFVKRALENAHTKELVRKEAEKQGFRDITAVPPNVLADIVKTIDKKKTQARKGAATADAEDSLSFEGEEGTSIAARLAAESKAEFAKLQQATHDEFMPQLRANNEDYDEDDEDSMDPEEMAEIISEPDNVRLADQFKLGDMNRHFPDFSEAYNVPKPSNAEERKRRDVAGEVYTEVQKASAHSNADVSKYFEFPESLIQAVPASMMTCLKEEFQFMNKLIMVREVGLKVNSVLKQIQLLSAGPGINRSLTLSLHGSRLSGKSTQLLYSIQYALENGWLVLPTNAYGVSSDNGVISRSAKDRNLWDQPHFTQKWFQTLIGAQADTLKKIKLQTPEAKALAGSGSDLFSLVEAASQSAETAAAALFPFFAEVKATNDVPVLAVLDGINALDTPSSFFDPDTAFKHIPGRRLSLLSAFDDLVKNPPAWGATLFAHSNHHNLKMFNKNQELADQTFEVPRYTLRELASASQHYHIHNYLIRSVTDVVVGKLVALSGGLPGELRRVIQGV